MLSIVPQNTRPVLVGASRFLRDPTNLPELPAVAANVEDLKRVLADPQAVGVPDENIVILLDEQNPHVVTSRVADEARKAVDTFIFYYAGHGIVGRTFRELYLATQETTLQNAEFDAISFETIRRAMAQSTATKRILILDCCYSGRALEGAMGSESDVQQAQLDLQGTYSIASAPANKAAISPPGERHTAFTGELLKVLDGGLDNGKEELTISDIYDHIRNEFRRRTSLPEPQQSMYQDAGRFVIAHNRKFGLKEESQNPFVLSNGAQISLPDLTALLCNRYPGMQDDGSRAHIYFVFGSGRHPDSIGQAGLVSDALYTTEIALSLVSNSSGREVSVRSLLDWIWKKSSWNTVGTPTGLGDRI
jgi:caspase domain-containing protein